MKTNKRGETRSEARSRYRAANASLVTCESRQREAIRTVSGPPPKKQSEYISKRRMNEPLTIESMRRDWTDTAQDRAEVAAILKGGRP